MENKKERTARRRSASRQVGQIVDDSDMGIGVIRGRGEFHKVFCDDFESGGVAVEREVFKSAARPEVGNAD